MSPQFESTPVEVVPDFGFSIRSLQLKGKSGPYQLTVRDEAGVVANALTLPVELSAGAFEEEEEEEVVVAVVYGWNQLKRRFGGWS